MLKVCENVAPLLRTPESQIPFGAPGEPEVLLWQLAIQVHWTVSPGWIVTDGGEKRLLLTVTIKVVALARDGLSAKSRPMPRIAAMLWRGEVLIPFPRRGGRRLRPPLLKKHRKYSPGESCLCISFYHVLPPASCKTLVPEKRNSSVTLLWSPASTAVYTIGE